MENRTDLAVAHRWAEVAEAEREPDAVDLLAARLLAVADTCRSVTRDGDLEITSAAQFVQCAKVAERLAELEPVDPDLARRSYELREQVLTGRDFRWSDPARTAALGLAAVVVAFGGASLGGGEEDVAMVVVSAVLGSALLFATILTSRRPVWRTRAELVAPMVRRHGL
ncbi:hypothetical protein ADK67_38725 [Saccharothrix sp. NRRL B-16348]|uniref:hypothetical protein n=1 Tax=Saccharothrix sp. NRRL B-16348 TaxID=1415542 RepID=UPI0006AEFFCA|nr:hypothetical protein [Saccharothrix sp. NRRL B-16348]KOX17285.1 hypothetical protein ADK67_38725 [Saccharothrix sp. NRRL B-16348]